MTEAGGLRAILMGIGNTLMGDDGVGPVVARSCMLQVPDGCEVVVGETAGMALIPYFLKGVPMLVVDALDIGAAPGEIFRFRPDDAGMMELRSNSLHGCGLPYLITTARMRGVEPDVIVWGIQVANVFPDADTLSVPVANGADRVRGLVLRDLRRLIGETAGEPARATSASPIA